MLRRMDGVRWAIRSVDEHRPAPNTRTGDGAAAWCHNPADPLSTEM